MEHEELLQCSQEPVNGPYPKPGASISQSNTPTSLLSTLVLS